MGWHGGSAGRSREGIIDDVIMHEIWHYLCKKHAKKMLLELQHLYLIGLLPTNILHIIYYNAILGFLRKCSLLNVK